jgi:hypothetical protein
MPWSLGQGEQNMEVSRFEHISNLLIDDRKDLRLVKFFVGQACSLRRDCIPPWSL